MKYVIMAGGPATRWKNYQNTTKHLIKIGNENLLERIVRQLKENNAEEIYIISDNPLYEVEGATRIPLIFEYKLYNMFYKDFLNEECVFLYGDTWYNDNVVEEIVNKKTEGVDFFGTTESIVGIKVINHRSFKYYVDDLAKNDINRAGWALYRRINKINDTEEFKKCDNLVLIDEEDIANVNDESDFNLLLQKIIIILLKNQKRNSNSTIV
ncbi:MAG: NTP transferase domain-containing protein [Bacilli bacterium]|nr:NTP transferase domain-containing protein [Bacilli bacterium]